MLPDEKKVDPIRAVVAAGKRKPRTRARFQIFIAVVVVAAGLTVAAWLSLPGRKPAPLKVIAADGVIVPGETVTLRAWVRPANPTDQEVSLEGHDLLFLDRLAAAPGGDKIEKRLEERATTGLDGEASISWLPPEPLPSVFVRVPGHASSWDAARVFVWSATSKILVVEARHALMAADAQTFQKAPVPRIQSATGAATALTAAKKKGYSVVYLATSPDQPDTYQKLRGWLQRTSPLGGETFPDGPALARTSYSGGSEDASSRGVLATIKAHFKGAIVGIAGRARDAELFQKQSLKTYWIAAEEKAEAPNGVKKLKSWVEVLKELP